MKLLFAAAALLVMAAAASAQQPSMHVYSDRYSYFSGENCLLTIKVDTFGLIDRAEVGIELATESGRTVDGVIFRMDVPDVEVVNRGLKETSIELYGEGPAYMAPEKTIYRTVSFRVAEGLPSGIYKFNVMLSSPSGGLLSSSAVEITGRPGTGEGLVLVMYIFLMLYTIYILVRD
jgi:hypothetical protein